MAENEASQAIVTAAIEVHRTLGGPGLLESVYEEALCWELGGQGLHVERQVAVPVVYKGHVLGTPCRVDIVVGSIVLVECKAVSAWNPVFVSQALTYLRLMDLKLGLVINFGETRVADGVHRVVNGL